MIIDCISDLHGFYPRLEGGDLLIVGGDWTKSDGMDELEDFEKYWLKVQNYKKIILIAGNHDNIAYQCGWVSRGKIEYLCDSGTEFEGLKIWGSPWTLAFNGMNPHCKAFTVDKEEQLEEKWKNIPQDTDILVTHCPPWGVMDTAKVFSCGSMHLFLLLKYSIRPRLHVFGHIHEGYGQEDRFTNCISVNASHVNEKYQPVNKPIRIEL